MHVLSKHAVLSGDVNYCCLLCELTFTRCEQALTHVTSQPHLDRFSASSYAEKYADQRIRKVKQCFYCEACNAIITSSRKIAQHVTEVMHQFYIDDADDEDETPRSSFRRLGHRVVAREDVLIEEEAWNGIVDSSCIVCDVDWDDVRSHVADAKHVINLIQLKIVGSSNSGSALLRQIDQTNLQCLTCNTIISQEQSVNHSDSREHQTLYIKSRRAKREADKNAVACDNSAIEQGTCEKTTDEQTKTTDEPTKSNDAQIKTIDKLSNTNNERKNTTDEHTTDKQIKTTNEQAKTTHVHSKTEHLKITSEQQKTTDAQPKVTCEQTKVTGEQTNTTNEPNKTIDEPTKTADEPTKTADDPTKSADEPTKTADEATKTTDEPAKSTDEPTKTTDKPMKTTDAPTKSADEPTKTTDEPTKTTDEPTKITDKPMKTTDEPTKITKEQTKNTDIQKEQKLCRQSEQKQNKALEQEKDVQKENKLPDITSINCSSATDMNDSIIEFVFGDFNSEILSILKKKKHLKINLAQIDLVFGLLRQAEAKSASVTKSESVLKEPGTSEKTTGGATTPVDDKDNSQRALSNYLFKYEGESGEKALCLLCNVCLQTKQQNCLHINGVKHKKNVAKYEKSKEAAGDTDTGNKSGKDKLYSCETMENFTAIWSHLGPESSGPIKECCIINDTMCIDVMSFCLSMIFFDRVVCVCCKELLAYCHFEQHFNSTAHKLKFAAVRVVVSLKGEFVREIDNEKFHCGFCNILVCGWRKLEKHLESPKHLQQRRLYVEQMQCYRAFYWRSFGCMGDQKEQFLLQLKQIEQLSYFK